MITNIILIASCTLLLCGTVKLLELTSARLLVLPAIILVVANISFCLYAVLFMIRRILGF
jgi:hypothetical protein